MIFLVSVSILGVLLVLDFIIDISMTFERTNCEEKGGTWLDQMLDGVCLMDSRLCEKYGGTSSCGVPGQGLSCREEACEFWMYDYSPPG